MVTESSKPGWSWNSARVTYNHTTRGRSLASYLLDKYFRSDRISNAGAGDPERVEDRSGDIRHHVTILADAAHSAQLGSFADHRSTNTTELGENIEYDDCVSTKDSGSILPIFDHTTITTTGRPSLNRLSSSAPLLALSPSQLSPVVDRARFKKGTKSHDGPTIRRGVMTALGLFVVAGFAMGLIASWMSKTSKEWLEFPYHDSDSRDFPLSLQKKTVLSTPREADGLGTHSVLTWRSLDVIDTSASRLLMACSHNDEMQGSYALRGAVALGYGFIEADVHLGPATLKPSAVSLGDADLTGEHPDLDTSLTLLVGHDKKDLSSTRTLKGVYLDPLFSVLKDRNGGRDTAKNGWKGVYENVPDANIVLMIDMKADGETIWPYLISALEPFRSKSYLTHYNATSGTYTRGPLTIVGTGSTPLSKVYYSTNRYIFYDAPLSTLSRPFHLPKSNEGPAVDVIWDHTISPIASSKFPLAYYLSSLKTSLARGMRSKAAYARSKGIESRWWGAARYPSWVKRSLWSKIRSSGASVMNVDDLIEYKEWLIDQETKGDGDGNLY
ncbi:hypothetical protein I317_05538 [Kwoniella heveanensis CBS 569]|nr:hypothetical protein I317_05538 [Kwoniella heveanensis CBS 569]